MKLLRLRLENFRQHACTEVEFRDGMTAIVGANGTGKTTLLEAVSFALFGEIRAGKVEDLRFFWSDTKKYLARLTFALGDRRFEVERSTYDASLKEVTGEPKVWATGKDATTHACEKLLGLTHEQFVNSFCAEQKALAFLQFRNNAAKQDEVARMLGYDKLKHAEALAADRRKALQARRVAIQETLGNLAELEAARADAQQRLDEARKRAAEAKAEAAELSARREAAEALAAKATEWLRLSQEMAVIEGRVSGLKENLRTTEEALKRAQADAAELAQLEPVAKEWSDVERRLAELRKAYEEELRRQQVQREAEARLKEAQEIDAELKGLPQPALDECQARVTEAIRRHADLESAAQAARDAWQKARAACQSSVARAEANLSHARQTLAHAEKMAAQGQCPECGQPIGSGYEPILESRRQAVREAEAALEKEQSALAKAAEKPKELDALEEQLAKSKEDHHRLQNDLEQARSISQRIALLQQARTKAQQQADKLLASLEGKISPFDAEEQRRLEQRRKELEPKHHRYLAVRDCAERLAEAKQRHEQAQAEHDRAREQYQAFKVDRKALGFDHAEEATAAQQAHQKLQTALQLLEGNLMVALRDEKAAQRELDTAVKSIAEHKQRKREVASIEKQEALHQTTGGELKTLRVALNAELGPDLQARASENLALLTNGRYLRLELDHNFLATVIDQGEVPKAVISGGEEDVVALSLRLALSELIQERQGRPMSLLILDEVFGSLDTDRRQAVMERLAALKGRFDQILVISHIEEINQVADQCLYLSRDSATRATTVTDATPIPTDLDL